MLPESRSRGNVGEMDVEEGVMIPAWWGVRSSHANVHSVQHSWHLASLLLFHCIHIRVLHHMPPCLHICSRHAHMSLEQLIITDFSYIKHCDKGGRMHGGGQNHRPACASRIILVV